MGARKIMIMAGGTGGHVFPALTIADHLAEQGVEVSWLGTPQGIEQRLVPQRPYTLHTVPASGVRGRSLRHRLLALWQLLRALGVALRLLRRVRPAVVLGMGSFASAAGGLAARLLGIPLLIHEQNAVAGTTNRLLAPLANRIMHAFPGTFPAGRRVVCTGNPVRAGFARMATAAVRPDTIDSATDSGRHFLVLGGSQGAARLNTLVPEALAHLAMPSLLVRHQTGERNLQTTQQAYTRCGVHASLFAFDEDMPALYQWADLVLCRAGAMTIAELTAAGVGSVLVPFPHAIDDHQSANAGYLSGPGAAVLLPEGQLDAESLAGTLRSLLHDPARLADMAGRARALYRADATEQIASHCLEYLS